MSEINDIEELPEVTFPINLKLIQEYQWAEPNIRAKYKKWCVPQELFFVEVVIL